MSIALLAVELPGPRLQWADQSVRLTPEVLALADTPHGPIKRAWREQDWARLLPVVRAWAYLGIPFGLRLSMDEQDDIAARTVVKAWTANEVPDDPKPWTQRVARNLALDIRKSVREGRDHVPLRTGDDPAFVSTARADEVLDEMERRQRVGRLRNALRRLPADMRRVVVLHFMHSTPHDEIARMVGITVGACKMRAHRGLKLLKVLYTDEPLPSLHDGVPMKSRGRPKVRGYRQLMREFEDDRHGHTGHVLPVLRAVGGWDIRRVRQAAR